LAETAKYERSQILTRLVGAQIKLVRMATISGGPTMAMSRGGSSWIGKKKCALFPDPERAPFFRAIFAMRAEGVLSDEQMYARSTLVDTAARNWQRWDAQRTTVVGTRRVFR